MTNRTRLLMGPRALWSPHVLSRSVLIDWFCADDLANGSVVTWTGRFIGTAPTQATGSSQGVAAATSFNSAYRGLTLDGVDDSYTLTSVPTQFPTGGNTGWMMAVVTQEIPITDTATRTIFAYGTSTANNGRLLQRRVASGVSRFAVADGGSTPMIDSNVMFEGPHIVFGQHEASLMTGAVDGYPIYTFAPSGTINTATTRTRIGAGIGSAPGSTLYKGVYRHIFIGAGALSSANLDRMTGWCAWDSGLQNLLPQEHPYKHYPP